MTSKTGTYHGQSGTKTANTNSKKQQSPLTTVVIGHHHSRTAHITNGRGCNEVSLVAMYALVTTLARVAYNTIALCSIQIACF
jgi:hypothetical protein